ncbi:ATP-binding protein [Oleiagrimonas sp. C23AA]|uniref:two-component system sensor histidine kinase NtrB n=1 Tax=Oleiagrimonas sp. C23AA TaxID=2719047 RepID=UPI00141D7EED|nr:ATP-binding protein [Oleiagrimonas sp. C23AA]NII10612.1 PAS domain-containing sensor histidine kinase [Oleiagrimonas sp. C23AA]
MAAPLSSDLAERLTTGLAVLDTELRVVWLNGALADLLAVGVRGLRGQVLSGLISEPGFAAHAARARSEGRELRLRGITLTTLQGGEQDADLALQPLGDGQLLLEVHPLAAAGDAPTPLSATLRGFAHEMKNPLAGLRGAAQLLQRRVEEDELRDLAAMVIAEADRLTTLANRLLHQGERPHLAPVNVHELVERAAQVVAREPREVPLKLLRDYDPSLPSFTGDADRLQQLLLNLVRNAAEAGAAQIVLRSRVDHGVRVGNGVARAAIRIDIADNGAGVPDALRGSLFAPLVSGRAGGTGLGLALAQEIARDHGGELRYTSHPGETVFSLYLPLGEPV